MIDLFAWGGGFCSRIDLWMLCVGYCWKRWSIFRYLCGKDGARVKGDSGE